MAMTTRSSTSVNAGRVRAARLDSRRRATVIETSESGGLEALARINLGPVRVREPNPEIVVHPGKGHKTRRGFPAERRRPPDVAGCGGSAVEDVRAGRPSATS